MLLLDAAGRRLYTHVKKKAAAPVPVMYVPTVRDKLVRWGGRILAGGLYNGRESQPTARNLDECIYSSVISAGTVG